jgi:Fe-S cluster assembly iron-binding protein IscA
LKKEVKMLTVTERAKDMLLETLVANTNDREIGLRLTIRLPGQFGLALDRSSPADEVVEHEGLKLLLVEGELANKLEGYILDVEDTAGGKDFIVTKGG